MKWTTKRLVKAAKVVATVVLVASAGIAQALPFTVFHGRNADGTINDTCTSTGATKCALIYDSNLNITILNNWNIGAATWGPGIVGAGTAQGLAEQIGRAHV